MNTLKSIKNRAILIGISPLTKPIFRGILTCFCLLGIMFPQANNADLVIAKTTDSANKIVQTVKVVLTAYSSTEDQTDSTPFITASNKHVKDGIIANNMLPFGTRVRIPELYGDKIFVVEDRMHKRKGNYRVDIWMPERQLALNFGVKTANIEILEN